MCVTGSLFLLLARLGCDATSWQGLSLAWLSCSFVNTVRHDLSFTSGARFSPDILKRTDTLHFMCACPPFDDRWSWSGMTLDGPTVGPRAGQQCCGVCTAALGRERCTLSWARQVLHHRCSCLLLCHVCFSFTLLSESGPTVSAGIEGDLCTLWRAMTESTITI